LAGQYKNPVRVVSFDAFLINADPPRRSGVPAADGTTDFSVLILVADRGGPTTFGRIGVMRAVPIVNPIRWRLIENRAMLLVDVRFVQTDLWGGDRSATVARNA
jgi:hypothetical protein